MIGSILIFAATTVLPGDAASAAAGLSNAAATEQLREYFGIDRPYATRYLQWLASALRFDFGESWIQRVPVASIIARRAPTTAILTVGALLLSVTIAIPLGFAQASRYHRLTSIISRFGVDILLAIPEYWLAIMLIFCFAVFIPLFPLFGTGGIQYLILPIATLGIARAAPLSRIVHGSIRDLQSARFVLAARGRGIPPSAIRWRYLLRGASIPVVAFIAIQGGYLISGAVIIEQIFALPGIGHMLISAIQTRDLPVIQATSMILTAMFIAFNLTADISMRYIDPQLNS